MPANLNAVESFSTLHCKPTLTAEITLHTIKYITAGTQLVPMGGGLGSHRAYHPVALVSRALRKLHLGQRYNVDKPSTSTTFQP